MPLRIRLASFSPLEHSCIKSCRLSTAVPKTSYHHQRAQSTFGYHQAKSLVYSKHGEPSDVLELHTHSISPPHSNLITLRTLAAPVNPSDVNQIQGRYANLPPFTDALSTPTPSAVPGNEGCFEVIAIGSSVKTVAKGDWVIPRAQGLGTWRTHLQVDEASVRRVEREGLSQTQVATVSVNPVTAWRLLKDFVDLEGGWFLHNGANSSVGRTLLQLAKLWGLKNIAIVGDAKGKGDKDELKRTLELLGATKVFTESEFRAREFKATVAQLTNGQEVRLGLNCIGGGDRVSKMSSVLSPGGQLITYGNMSRGSMRLSAGSLIFRDLTYRGFWLSRWSKTHPEEKEKTVGQLLDLMRDGKLDPPNVTPVNWQLETPETELVKTVAKCFGERRKQKDVFVFPSDLPKDS